MNEKLKIGDIVTLKSGGPDMTIEEYPISEYGIEDPTKAKCVWFNDKRELCNNIFHIDTLEKYDPTQETF